MTDWKWKDLFDKHGWIKDKGSGSDGGASKDKGWRDIGVDDREQRDRPSIRNQGGDWPDPPEQKKEVE